MDSEKRAETVGLTVAETVELLQARAAFYRMIASFYFKELDEDGVARLRALDMRSFAMGIPGVDDGLGHMAAFLERCGSNGRQELAVDFARCFLGAGAYDERRPTPYESVFTSETGLLMQEARDDAYRLYCQEEIGVDPALQMPEDHLAFECEFMAALCDRAAEALVAGDRETTVRQLAVQEVFWRNHLENWIDDYCDCLDKCASTRFYRGVSLLTRGFVHEDGALLAQCREAVTVL